MRKRSIGIAKGILFMLISVVMILCSPLEIDYGSSITTENDNIDGEYTIDEEGTLVKYTGNEKDICIPKGVKKIGDRAFAECSFLRSVDIPDTVLSIGESAFRGCTLLFQVTIPESVVDIGDYAFNKCENLENIELPSQIKVINRGLFANCYYLNRITIPEGVIEIKSDAFSCCEGLISIILPDSLRRIESFAFRNCGLRKIEIPKGIKVINSYTFNNCSYLSEVVLPEGVTTIDNNVFACCHTLKKIVLPKTLKVINPFAFSESGIETITIPDSVKVLEYGAFSECDSLTEVKLSENLQKIEDRAFYDCKELSEVTIPNNHTIISGEAFVNTKLVLDLNEHNPLLIINGVLVGCYKDIDEISIPNGVFTIGGGAFKGSSIKKVSIPSSVKVIDKYAFADCEELEEINFSEGLEIINESAFSGCHKLNSIELPIGLLTIEKHAFSHCHNLTNVLVPNSVISVGGEPFEYTSWLDSERSKNPLVVINNIVVDGMKCSGDIIIPDKITSIAAYSFCNNRNIKSVKFPKSLVTIREGAFAQTTLKKVDCSGSKPIIYDYAFYGCEYIGDYDYKLGGNQQSSIFSVNNVLIKWSYVSGHVVIPDDITKIDAFAFTYDRSIESVIIPGSVKIIGMEAFWGCSANTIILQEGVQEIGQNVFNSNTLKKLVIPKSVKFIGKYMATSEYGLVVYGYEGSYAQEYCELYDIDFVALDKQNQSGSIIIYDYDTGEAIPNMKAMINGKSYTTDAEGYIKLSGDDLDSLTIQVKGYDDLVKKDHSLDPEDPYPIGLTQDESFNQPITKVILEGTGRYRAFKSDILEKEVSYMKNTTMKCNIAFKTESNGKAISRYVIKSNNHILLESNSGVFEDVKMSLFKPGARITALVVYEDGTRSKQVELKINNYDLLRE